MTAARWFLAASLAAATSVTAQTVALEHFTQNGPSWSALASDRAGTATRVICGGLASAISDPTPSRELVARIASGLTAVALKPEELLALVRVRARQGELVPFVACNVKDENGAPAAPGFVVRELEGTKVAFVGLTALPTRGAELPIGWRVEDPYYALNSALQEVQKQTDRVVVVSTLGVPEARTLLGQLNAGFVLLALGTRGADSEPVKIGRNWLSSTVNGGQALASATLTWKDGKPDGVRQAFRSVHLSESEQRSLAELQRLRTGGPASERGPASRPASRRVEGLGLVGLDATRVNLAIERGRKALWTHVKKNDLWSADRQFGGQEQHWLVALALVHSRAHLDDKEVDRAIRGALASVEPRKLGTYAAGLLCMLIEDLGDPRYFPQLREAARMLVESQGPQGSWGYGIKVPDEVFDGPRSESPLQVNGGRALDDPTGTTERWTRITSWEFGGDGDSSAAQFALLGLRSASRLGIRIPPETWKRSLAYYCRNQAKGGGWAYTSSDDKSAYGSMTLAGISSLVICRHELQLDDPTVDARLDKAITWIAERFSVTQNPNEKYNIGYYLYSLERTGRILATEHFGEHEWYPRGCRHLVDTQQRDGLWVIEPSENDPRLATSFALLFLTRATATLAVEVERGGKGKLRADVVIPPRERIYFVLDASGSMLEALAGGTKFDAARAALAKVTRMLAPGARIAIRAYGHRLRAIEPGADEDTELLIAPGPLDHAEFQKKLLALRARGKTPLATSLSEAEKDLKAIAAKDAPTIVLLLSDGGEDTQARRDPILAATKLAALPGVVLHVVGFDIGREDWRKQLEEIAMAGRGGYFPAGKGDDLAKTVRDAFLRCPDGYSVLDAKGVEVARGAFGDEVELPEGRYTFRTEYGKKLWSCRIWINTNRTSSVSFDGSLLRTR